MRKYAIWNKKDMVIVPTGKVYTAEQWIEKYPIAGLDHIVVVGSAGEINGGFFGTLGQMKQIAEAQGCDFSDCTTNEEILEAIEVFEDEMNKPSTTPTIEERQATALEAIANGATKETTAVMNALLTGEEM